MARHTDPRIATSGRIDVWQALIQRRRSIRMACWINRRRRWLGHDPSCSSTIRGCLGPMVTALLDD